MRTFILLVIVAALAAGSASADFEAITIKNAGLSRVVSGVSNILKTTDVMVGDYSLVGQPTMEFMLELDFKGEKVYLVPTDFDIKGLDRTSKNREDTLSVELRSRYEGLPITMYVDYMRLPGALYQQKSISVPPCKEAKGAVLRRVTVESIRFRSAVQPLSVSEAGFGNDPKTAFAFVEPKSGKGVCFDFPSGKVSISNSRSLLAVQEMEVPIEKGWQSGKFGLSAVSGSPEAAFKAYSQFLLDTRYPALAKDAKLGALEKRFTDCFAACQYLPPCSADGRISAIGHVSGNKGFIFLLNSGGEPAKAVLPLAAAKLGLTGDLKLSDWTSLDKPTEIGTKVNTDKIELDVDAHGYRIVGVNVE